MFDIKKVMEQYGSNNVVFRAPGVTQDNLVVNLNKCGYHLLTTQNKPATYMEMIEMEEINRRVIMGELRVFTLDGDSYRQLH